MAENIEEAICSPQVKKKLSLGKQCAAFGCYNFSYDSDHSASGLHFFKFPQKNPEKRIWCNLIKRVDGLDGFKVTSSTVLCQEHFKDADIKRNPQRWKIRDGSVPSLKLYNTVPKITKTCRKTPKVRSFSPELLQTQASSSTKICESSDFPQEDVSNFRNCSTQTNFSFITAPAYFNDAPNEYTKIDHCYVRQESSEQREYVSLQEKIDELSLKISNLNAELSTAKEALFSLEKLLNNDSAVKFYTGFPNYSSLQSAFEYLEPKLQKNSYWRG